MVIACGLLTSSNGINEDITKCVTNNDCCKPHMFPNLSSYVCRLGVPNYRPCDEIGCSHSLGNVPIDLNPCAFFRECYCHAKGIDANADYIFNGVQNGFMIVDPDSDIPKYRCTNYNSVTESQFTSDMCINVSSEIAQGKVSHVYDQPQCIHAIGGVEKKDGSLRPITDCRRPIGISINNYMCTTAKEFHYKTLDYVADIILPGDYLSVVDISSAYRTVHIFPAHRTYQGFSWEDRYYVDNRLAFGLKCAPFIFTCISDFIVRTLGRYGYHRCVNYIDDFLCIGDSYDSCFESQQFLIKLLNYVGFEVSYKKIVQPAQRAVYLGIYVDTNTMEYSLPQEKLCKLFPLLKEFETKKSATKVKLQSLAGFLAHCSYVVRGGRAFTRRLIDLIKSLPTGGSVGVINDLVRADLSWWTNFAKMFNGRAKIIGVTPDQQLYFCTDSSMTGFGATFRDDFLLGVWGLPQPPLVDYVRSAHWTSPPIYTKFERNINLLEMWPVLCAIIRWGPLWRDSRVTLYTDNMQVLHAINTNRSKNKVVMQWLREIFWSSFVHNFHLVAKWVKSRDNILPDCLSRVTNKNARNVVDKLLIQGHYCFRPLEETVV